MKKIFVAVALLAMAIMLLLYPQDGLESAKGGLDLWINAVVPSLLPFMVASFILLETGIVRLIAALFAPVTRMLFNAPGQSAYILFASALSGYPVGAALTSELYKNKRLGEREAQRILRFTSVSGPVFLTGAVSIGMLGIPEAGAYLAVSHYISAVLVGVAFGLASRRTKGALPREKRDMRAAYQHFRQDVQTCRPFGEILSHSVEKAVWTLLKVGGFIVFFSVITRLLSVSGIMNIASWFYTPVAGLTGLSEAGTEAMLIGGIEMTTGCSQAAAMLIGIDGKLPIISSIVAFGGLCIHMQTRSVCLGSGLVPRRFILAKGLQALFAYLLCMLSLWAFPLTITASSIKPQTKTAAYAGVAFAAASLLILLIIKYVQRKRLRRPSLPFSRKL